MNWTLVIISFFPIVAFCIYAYNLNKNKDSIKMVIKMFIAGILSVFLVVGLKYILSLLLPLLLNKEVPFGKIELFIYIFISIALIEEVCKWLCLYCFSYNSKEFDYLFDIILYAIYVSLGFAFFENILYVDSLQTVLLRTFTSLPAHISFATIMGYYLGKYKYENNKKYFLFSIIYPIILHTIYDYCIYYNSFLATIIFFVIVTILYFITIVRIKEVLNNNKKLISFK